MNRFPITDDELVARVAAGDASALEQLYDRYMRQCFGLALRMLNNAQLAEEVVQEVFLKLWTQPDKYSPEKGRFVSWLLSLVHHRCIDELRRHARTEVPLEESEGAGVLETQPDKDPDPSDQVALLETRKAVRAALAAVQPNQRQILELAYFGGLSQSEIAAKLNQPLGTVKTRMRAGLHQLRALLEGQYGVGVL